MTTISALVIADSVGPRAPRLTTMLLRYPLVIHAELMTHRVFSRNAASSRAIPFEKMMRSVIDDPFVPLVWTRNQPGMQGYTELHSTEITLAKDIWMQALSDAVKNARKLSNLQVHKQIVNRLFAPFAHITVVVSSTQWSNWMALRDHPKAEPHIRMLARKMAQAYGASTPRMLNEGDWHLPFVGHTTLPDDKAIRLSVARCASTSYKTVDDFDMTQERADKVYIDLLGDHPLHASPAEHQARLAEASGEMHLNGNFARGWVQYRKTLKGECQ